MRRQRHNTSDSLELLLDTICNIFGGIILMAILIVIQTQVTAGRLPQPTAQDDERALQSRKILFECDRLQQKINDMEKQKEHLTNSYQSSTTPITAQILEGRRKFSEAIKKAIDEEKRIRDELNQARQILGKSDLSTQEIESKCDAIRKEIDKMKQQLENVKGEPSKQIRLPHHHHVIRNGYRYYVIKGNRACFLDKVRYGSAFKSGHCRVNPMGNIFSQSARITPIENEGYPVHENSEPTEFIKSLDRYGPSTHSVTFFVYGDSESFATFQKLKHTILEKGYLYHVSAYEPDEGLIVSPTASLPME